MESKSDLIIKVLSRKDSNSNSEAILLRFIVWNSVILHTYELDNMSIPLFDNWCHN